MAFGESDVCRLFVVSISHISDNGYRGTWLSDPLQEYSGRRPALFIAAIFCVVLVIGMAHSK